MSSKDINEKTSVTEKVNTEIFTLVTVTIGLCAYAWDISFNFGAFGVIFLGHFISIWIFSLSILLVTIVLKINFIPGRKKLGYFMLFMPSVWLILKIIDDVSKTVQITDKLIHLIGTIVLVFSLPYITYLFFYFTNPSVIYFKRKFLMSLTGIVLFITVLGYILGSHNYLIMSCNNFIVSGQDTPKNCKHIPKSITN